MMFDLYFPSGMPAVRGVNPTPQRETVKIISGILHIYG
jgi:hypothetical protein